MKVFVKFLSQKFHKRPNDVASENHFWGLAADKKKVNFFFLVWTLKPKNFIVTFSDCQNERKICYFMTCCVETNLFNLYLQF